MSKKSLEQKLADGVFFLDGAMGTQLIAGGIEAGVCNEMLNVESPEIILEIHRSYFQAGSDAVLTNTFGGNGISLARHGLADKIKQINTAAAKIAKQAADSAGSPQAGEDKYVLGDMGPSGDFLKPLGNLEPDVLKNAYAKQAKALYEAGVDGFAIETFMAIDEAEIVIEAIKSICSLPVFVSFAFDSAGKDFKTMMGASVKAIAAEISALDITAIGFNCGTLQMEQYLGLAEKFARLLADKDILLLAEPNAGQPELIDGKAVYKLSDTDFANWIQKICQAGATILGGCCGTTPEHIKAMTKKLKN